MEDVMINMSFVYVVLYILNVLFVGLKLEVVVYVLEEYGVYVLMKFVCFLKVNEVSRVLVLMGVLYVVVVSVICISLVLENIMEEVK